MLLLLTRRFLRRTPVGVVGRGAGAHASASAARCTSVVAAGHGAVVGTHSTRRALFWRDLCPGQTEAAGA